ncbi:MAG: NAD(P)-binding domain-containing protein [Anaerolineales bacterium]|nr:NAD(P)-binding domain-containing protein [Anaerolineales bacterium]
MNIGILGTGNIGGTLGKVWAHAGHQVVFGTRDVNSPKIQPLLERAGGNARADTVANAINFGEVLLFAIPWAAVAATMQDHAHSLQGKIVLDATNNFAGAVINNVGTILGSAPTASVYRAFNSLGWDIFDQSMFGEVEADLFYCGPEGENRPVVEALIADVGLRPVYVGDLDQVQLVDNLGALWVTLAFQRGMGRQFAFKILNR